MLLVTTVCLSVNCLEMYSRSKTNEFCKYKNYHTRKISRITVNKDLIHALLIRSDPLLSSIRKLPNKYHLNLLSETKNLLI